MSWEQFLEALSPSTDERILDVGGGKGAIAARVMEASKGGEVYAIDPNGRRVAAMKKEHPTLKSSVAKAESLPFSESFFGKVYTTMALHHYDDMDKALQEFARVMKHGGKLVVLEVDPQSGKGLFFRSSGGSSGST